MAKRDPLTLWRRKAARDKTKAELSEIYRAAPMGEEGPRELAAIDELCQRAVDRPVLQDGGCSSSTSAAR